MSISRRALLRAAAVGTGAAVAGGPASALGTILDAAAPGANPRFSRADLRCYVVVLDGLRRGEISSGLMPRLQELVGQGTSYRAAQAVYIPETLPNHVAMMTGVRGARNGVPANLALVRGEAEVRTLERASDIVAPTLFEVLGEHEVRTAAVLSKKYLHSVFGDRPDSTWDPAPQIPESDHAPDVFTVDALLAEIDAHDPRFAFVNLGDIDRMGHVDVTGAGPRPVARTVVLADTDRQLGRVVDHLRDTGRWGRSVLILLADHSMDWSVPHQVVSVRAAFDADPLLRGRYAVAENGGAGLLYWIGDPAARARAVARMAALAAALDGVDRVVPSGRLELGERGGDLVLLVEAGWRFSDPGVDHNKIPGTHGHAVTLPIPFVVTGGSGLVRRGVELGDAVRPLDVAPTVAWLFGVPVAARRYQGRARVEAFTAQPV